MKRYFYFSAIILYVILSSLLPQGNTADEQDGFPYYFVQHPRPPRIYSRASSALGVTRVVAKRKITLPTADVEAETTTPVVDEFVYETTTVPLREKDEKEWGLKILGNTTCFPQYYLMASELQHYRYFQIGQCDGEISTLRYVDKPVGFIFNVTVVATDGLNKTLALKTMKIEVTEFNAKPPYLTRNLYSQEVLDITKVGTIIATITALDNDTEPYNKELYFSLQDRSNMGLDPWLYPTTGPLTINFTSGEIRLVSSLEVLTSPLHFRVGVTDGGSPQRSHSSKMIIHIRNISAPRNIKILNTTESTITVCWSSPLHGAPDGYLVSSVSRSANAVMWPNPDPLNITVEQLQTGAIGFMYDSVPQLKMDRQEFLTTGFPQEEIENFFSPDYCATLDSLLAYTNYAVSVRGWAENNKVSMARMPLTAVTRRRNCFSTTCPNGICQELNSPPGFACRCSAGYYGLHCQYIDPCYGTPLCQNGGTCLRNDSGHGYTCQCTGEYFGDHCEKKSLCTNHLLCQNGGTCLNSDGENFRCLCPTQYFGIRCEKRNPPSVQSVCNHENQTYPQGDFSWPVTLKGNTASLPCPFGVKGNDEDNDNSRGGVETTAEDMRVQIDSLPSYQQENFSYDVSVGKNDTEIFPRRTRSVLGVVEEITIPFVPTLERLVGRRYSRSVDSSVASSPMSTAAPSATTLLNSQYIGASARSAIPRATRSCAEDSFGNTLWLDPDLTFCKVSTNITAPLEVSTPVPEEVTSKIFASSVNQLANLVNKALSDERIANRMVEAISNLLNVNQSVFDSDDEEIYNATNAIMETINTYTSKVKLQPGQRVKIRAKNVVVEAKLLPKKDLPDEIEFMPFASDAETDLHSKRPNETRFSTKSGAIPNVELEKIWIKIPKEAVDYTTTDDVRFQFVSFKDDRIFRSRTHHKSLDMPVVAATINNAPVLDLVAPVTYSVPVHGLGARKVKPVCVFWDQKDGIWSPKGITTKEQNSGEVTCESTHLTAFSILLDPVAEPLDKLHEEVMSIITTVGLVISTVALVATIATFALFRSLNRDKSGIIVMNLSIALLLLNLSFIGSAFISTDSDWTCIPFGVLLHYAVAASFAWMLIEAQNMYQLLVTVFPSAETHFTLKRLLLGWGLPFGVVIVTLIWDKNVYINETIQLCIINPLTAPAVYYTTYLAPIAVVLFLNLVVFLRVTSMLCQRRPSYNRSSRSLPEKPSHKIPPVTLAQFRGAVTIVALLGITWIAGVLAVGKFRTFLQYSFCITTPLQGLIIFIVRVLQSAEARVAWRSYLATGSRRRRHPTQVSSIRTHSSHNSSLRTNSTGITPPNLIASAFRRLSLGTSSQGMSNGVTLSKTRSSCNSNHSNNSKGRKYASKDIENANEKQAISLQGISLMSSYQCSDEKYNCAVNGKSTVCSTLLTQDSEANNTVFESKLDDEPLKELHQILESHPFFDKHRSKELDDESSLHEYANYNNKKENDFLHQSSTSLNDCNHNEENNLLCQSLTLNDRNSLSTSNLSPQKHFKVFIQEEDIKRSLDSLLCKPMDKSVESQSEQSIWHLVRLPPDGRCDPATTQEDTTKVAIPECNVNTDQPETHSKTICNYDAVTPPGIISNDSHIDIQSADDNERNKVIDILNQGYANEIKLNCNNFAKETLSDTGAKETLSDTGTGTTRNYNSVSHEQNIQEALLIPKLQLPKSTSYQNIACSNSSEDTIIRRSTSTSELAALTPL